MGSRSVSQSSHSLPCFISQQVEENSILRPTFSPGVHTDLSFARERPQSNLKSFSATSAFMRSGSLDSAFVVVPSIMSDKATSTNDTATFVDPSMTMLRGEIDDDALAWLLAERERHLRILAGVPDAASVDLSLVKLPGAL